jgi:hypothetical protein
MKNPKMKHLDSASNRSKTGKVGIKNRLKIIVTSALLLAATNAVAGIIFLPAGGQYTNPELAPVNVQRLDERIIRVHTTGLNGELTLKGSDFPPEYDIATTEKVVLPFDQVLELVINLSTGVVEGRASGQYVASTVLNDWIEAVVQGTATCLPLDGRDCGQLVVDLEFQGVMTDPNDPSIVGHVRGGMLGSLVWDGSDVAHWAAMSANTTIGGNEGLINSILSSMEDEEGGM